MDELLARINELYGLRLDFHEKVTKGSLSENHILIQSGKKYFLKKYRFENKEKIEEIQSVKKYFSAGGIPVILPLTNKEGKTFFSFDGRNFAIFPFVDEKQLERGSLTDTAIISLGEMLGKIHLLGKKAKLPIKENFKGWVKEKALEKIEAIKLEINKKSTPTDFDKLALGSIETKKRLILSDSTSYEDLNLPSDHLIHGDYLDHNVFFGLDDKVSHVFDFEKADYSPRTDELFRSIMYIFLDGKVTKKNVAKAKLYLDSYLKIYPASKDELKRGLRLAYLKAIHSIWIEGEHYLKNNFRVDGYLSSDFSRIKYLSGHFQELENAIIGS